VCAATFAGLAPLWAKVNRLPELTVLCWALVPAILAHAVTVVPDALLRRRMQVRALSVRVLAASLLSGAAGIAAALAGLGVWALVIQQLLLSTVNAVAVWAAVEWRPQLGPVGAAARELRSYSLHSASGFLAYFFAARGDALLLGGVFGPVAIGLYRFTSRLVELVVELAGGGLRQVSLSDLSRFAEDPRAMADRARQLLHGSALVALPALGVLGGTAGPLLDLLGPQWQPATPALQALCGVGAITALGGLVLSPTIQAAGRPSVAAAIGWAEAACCLLALGGAGVWLRHSQPSAQATAIALTYLVVYGAFLAITFTVVLRRILHAPAWPALRAILPAATAAAVAVAAGMAATTALPALPPLARLVTAAAGAAAAAAVTLLGLDPWVRRLVTRPIRPT
jgi:PST family polysaccharide transporter